MKRLGHDTQALFKVIIVLCVRVTLGCTGFSVRKQNGWFSSLAVTIIKTHHIFKSDGLFLELVQIWLKFILGFLQGMKL